MTSKIDPTQEEPHDVQAQWRRVVGRRSFLNGLVWRAPRRYLGAPCSRAKRWPGAALSPRGTSRSCGSSPQPS
jgi:hypothetical protein